MPTYDYECTSCGHRFELFQKMSDPPADSCPECAGTVRRLIGPGAGLLFKGSGFYITDYRSADYKTKAAGETPTSAGDSTKPGAKTESGGSAAEKKPKSKPDSGASDSGGVSSPKPEGGK